MKHTVCARSRIPGRAFAFAGALALAFSCLSGLNAAEFEVVDKLAVSGYSVLKSSAEVRGLLGVSTGAPQAALDVVSTGTASSIYAQIWRNGSGVEVASMTSEGTLYATFPPGAGGDDLGDHTATSDLNMVAHSVLSVSSMTMVGKGLQIGTDLTSSASGLFISTGGAIITLGTGYGTAAPGLRGTGAVDLQTYRTQAGDVASGEYSAVLGGQKNLASGENSVVAGGYYNIVHGTDSVISGGGYNEAYDYFSTVAGGNNNIAQGGYSFIGGGDFNYAVGEDVAIGGGTSNEIWGGYSFVGGGLHNHIFGPTSAGSYSAIAGGDSNVINGNYAAIPGGRRNSAAGDYSFAAGQRSSSTASGSFTWSDSQGVYNTNLTVDRTLFKNRGGFLVTGSTNTAMTGLLDRGLLITGDGLVGISTGVPYAALDVVSSGTASDVYAQIWRNGSGVEVASMTSQGILYATLAPGVGDNMGNHTATQRLNMGNYAIWSSSDISASAYQIYGSTVLFVDGSNTNVGIGAGASQKIQHDNTYLGYNAGYAHTGNGIGNIFIGSGAGENVTYSDYNVFIGAWAGGNENSSENIFIGAQAGMSATGSQNTMVGIFSGASLSNGEFNSFFGYNSGLEATTGSYATLIGYEAGKNSTIGTYNALLGAYAGRGAYGSAVYSSATVVGSLAGYSLTSGSDNIFLGYRAGYSVTSGTGNIVIGYDKGTSAPAASNELNIGGVLFGKLDDRTIGISTRAPQAALDIVSTGTAANIYAQIWRNGSGVVVASMTSEGKLFGDGSGLLGVSGGTNAAIEVSTISATASTPYGGISVTTNVFVGGSLGLGTNNPLAALEVRSYSDGRYTAVVSTSATADVYSVAVSSVGITHVNNLVIENRTSDPVAPVTGQIWFRVD